MHLTAEETSRLNWLRGWLTAQQELKDDNGNPITFDMSEWDREHSCGSTMCMGGALEAKFSKMSMRSISDYAVGKFIGLTLDQVNELFYNHSGSHSYSELTAEVAIQVLNKYETDNVIDWTYAVDAVKNGAK